jgi:predicted dinucleotide-binding enzyme
VTNIEAAHKLIVLARQTGTVAVDLGMLAGNAHVEHAEAELVAPLESARLRLEALASAIGKVRESLDGG